MTIKEFELSRTEEASILWNEDAMNNIYTPLQEKDFISHFFKNDDVITFAYEALSDDNQLVGFIISDIKKNYLRGENFDNTPAYISFILVKKEYRKKGVASELLNTLCSEFKKIGKKSVSITYRNPIMNEWHIPNNLRIRHNNAPGVPVEQPSFLFFSNKAFSQIRIEDGLYLDLSSFKLDNVFFSKKNRLENEGIKIVMYDKSIHYGFDDLFDALHGEVWRKTIADNEKRESPLPVLVATISNRIIGFAGPIDKEANGRGWFNGIATHPDFERRGIAHVLFCSLMNEFKNIGASFSTIFTDEENPALVLYKKVGFSVGCRFALMEKEL